MRNNEIPRRSRLDLVTPEEKALYEMVWQIEKLGAHVLLTDVVVLLGQAREKLADWVELIAAQQSVQADVMSCGHPQSAVVQSGEGTAYCGLCEASA